MNFIFGGKIFKSIKNYKKVKQYLNIDITHVSIAKLLFNLLEDANSLLFFNIYIFTNFYVKKSSLFHNFCS